MKTNIAPPNKITNILFLFLIVLSIPFYNYSQEIQIGDQIWQQKNLNVSFFQNGDSIPRAKTAEEWQEASQKKQPAWCYFNNDASSAETKGKLYNFYAVSDSRGLVPKGWKLPEYDDFVTLIIYYNNLIDHEELEGQQLIEAEKSINKLKKKFKNTRNDSIFITNNSINGPERTVVPVRSDLNHGSHLTNEVIEKIENAKLGAIVKVNEDNKVFRLFKIVDYEPVDFVSMQYLLLGKKLHPNEEEAKELADSILKVIQKEENFAEMVTLFSDDPASVDRGGVYKDFGRGVMVGNLEDFVFNNPVGSRAVISNYFGVGVVEVLDRRTELRPVVMEINKEIKPTSSVATHLKDRNEWSDFPKQARSDNKFKAVPGGIRSEVGSFLYPGNAAFFWTQTMYDSTSAITASIYSVESAPIPREIGRLNFGYSLPNYGLSVRCVKIEE